MVKFLSLFLCPELPLNISVMLGWSVSAKFIVQQKFSAIQYNCDKNMLKVAQIFLMFATAKGQLIYTVKRQISARDLFM